MLLLTLLGCPPTAKDTDTGIYDAGSTICGDISRESDCDGNPETVTISSVAAGQAACDDCDYDSGGNCSGNCDDAGNCIAWADEVAAEVPVNGDGTFEAELPAGEYGVEGGWGGCSGCVGVTVVEGACADVELEGREHVTADAPNVYLYPTVTRAIHVAVADPRRITVSDPVYPRGGWKVWAEPDGDLHTVAGPRDYLFYELAVDADGFQRRSGWCVHGRVAQASIEDAMEDLGFNGPEIDDFAEYWDASFPTAERVMVYPQLQKLPGLHIEPAPDVTLRAWFLLEAECRPAIEPVLEPVERAGYHAAEWGVIIAPPLPREAPLL